MHHKIANKVLVSIRVRVRVSYYQLALAILWSSVRKGVECIPHFPNTDMQVEEN